MNLMFDRVDTGEDVELVAELLGCGLKDLARSTGIGEATLKRWTSGAVRPSPALAERFYGYAYDRGLRINQIKAQFHEEMRGRAGRMALFHGSKGGLDGPVSLERCSPRSDFGRGFYCGTSLSQSASFVSMHETSSVYLLEFDSSGLSRLDFAVDEDWMLSIAWFRGRLAGYAGHPRVRALAQRVGGADYIVAPIADNRMYELVSDFIDGEITDVVCRHGLSATDLGMQCILLTQEAVDRVRVVEELYLCAPERAACLEAAHAQRRVGVDKTKAAKREFRGQGSYIDELLS